MELGPFLTPTYLSLENMIESATKFVAVIGGLYKHQLYEDCYQGKILIKVMDSSNSNLESINDIEYDGYKPNLSVGKSALLLVNINKTN